MTTRKRSTTSTGRRRTTRRSTSRRRSSRGYAYRRRRPKLATTVGSALGMLLVSLLLDASWPVRIGLVVLVLLVVGGWFVLQERREPDAAGEAVPPTDTPEDAA